MGRPVGREHGLAKEAAPLTWKISPVAARCGPDGYILVQVFVRPWKFSVDARHIKYNRGGHRAKGGRVPPTSTGFRFCFDTPPGVGWKISMYDDNPEAVKPFNFTLKNGTVKRVEVRGPYHKTGRVRGNAARAEGPCIRRFHGLAVPKGAKLPEQG